MKTNFVYNTKGLSVIEVLFSVFISGIVILTLNIFFTQMNLENKKLSDSSETIRKNYDFLELMNNPTTWKATVLDVQNYSFFSCKLSLNQHPDATAPVDCSKVDNKFRLIASDGGKSIIYDQQEKDVNGRDVGFTADGKKCFGFDKVNGDDNCPTHYEISWGLPCLKIGSCKEPMAKVSVKQVTKFKTKTEFNSEKNYSMNVNLPQSVEIAPRDLSYKVNINSPSAEFDVLKTDYAIDTFNLKIKKVESGIGSIVTIQNNRIVYTPKPSFYGVDKVYYTVEQNLFDKVTKADGVIWVRIMTPYTWVGEGSIGESNSVTGKKWYSLYDKRNWCGLVVDNKCTHFNANPQKEVDLVEEKDMRNASLVFNENCVNCDVLLKGLYSPLGNSVIRVNAIEISETFRGELKQIDDLTIAFARNSHNRKSDEPALKYAFWQKGGSFIGANSKATALLDEVSTQGKTLTIERDIYGESKAINIEVRPELIFQTYGHLGIEHGKFYAPENIDLYSGHNLIGIKNSFYHQNGRVTVFPRYMGGNTLDAPDVTLNEFSFNGKGGTGFGIMGSFTVKDFYLFQTGGETQMRGFINSGDGNIHVTHNMYLRGSGGFMVNGMSGWGYANFIMDGPADQYIYSNLDLDGNKDRTQIGRLPILTISKSAGIVHVKGDLGINTGLDIKQGSLKFYDEDERAVGDQQTVEFSSAWGSMFIRNTSGNELVLPNLEFAPQCSYLHLESDIRVTGDFSQDKKKYNSPCGGYAFGPNARKIFVEGDVYAKSGGNSYDDGGLVTIELTGKKNQRIVGFSSEKFKNQLGSDPATEVITNIEAAKGYLVHVDINKSAGKVTMTGAIGFMGRFRINNPGDGVDASQAVFSFVNANDCCSPGYALVSLGMGGGSKVLQIKGLNVQRSINLDGGTLEISDGLNLPSPGDSYNNGSVVNGTIRLLGNANVYYSDSFDRVTSDVNRANLAFVGIGTQKLYSVMSADGGRVGTFDIDVNKRVGDTVGSLQLDCHGKTESVFMAETLNIKNGNLSLNNCGLKITKGLTIENGDFKIEGTGETVVNGDIDRGANPGVFQYGYITNNRHIASEMAIDEKR